MNTEQKQDNVQDELAKARAKIAAVEKVMAELQGEEGTFIWSEIVYDKLHAAIYSDQWEQSTHDELRAQLSAFQAVAVQMVPGEHGEGVQTPATPDFLKNLIAGLQKEWDGAEATIEAQAKRIAELTGQRDACEQHVKIKEESNAELRKDRDAWIDYSKKLFAALEGLLDNSAVITPPQDPDAFVELQVVKRFYDAAYEALAPATQEAKPENNLS